jgi:DNA (cytosine-5)-methyltransferase 1
MTHGSLFSGIGGFDLAAEWMGWENKFHCEWNEFGQRVLNYYWPDAELFTDITKSDFKKYANQIDVLTGGFPCQPYSSAGKRLGKEDERHLWPQMLRAIREIAPRYVVGENVRGLTNWNGGLVFDEVCADLENLGYQVAPFIIPASAVNAPHQRERVWFVAHTTSSMFRTSQYRGLRCTDGTNQSERTYGIYNATRSNGNKGNATNSDSNGFNECDSEHEEHSSQGRINAFNDIKQNHTSNSKSIGQKYALENGEFERRRFRQSNQRNMWNTFPSQSPICGGDDGLPTELDGITFPKWRTESIKAYGNAIVPQVVYQIFKAIEAYERTLHTNHMGGNALR